MKYVMNERGKELYLKRKEIYDEECKFLEEAYFDDESRGSKHEESLESYIADNVTFEMAERIYCEEDEVGHYIWVYGNELPNEIEDKSMFYWKDKKQREKVIQIVKECFDAVRESEAN